MKKINEHKTNICKSPLYVKLFSLICDVPYDHIWYIVTLAQNDDTRQTVQEICMDRS